MSVTGNFSVLSYNVAGLPAFLSSGDPSTYSVEMGKRINKWDIVNVQEDFNYDDELCSENKHEYRTPTSGGVPFGSGLNTMSKFPFVNTTKLERITWKDCSNFEGADCMTPKGFTLVEVELEEGVTIDIYNLHTDAGTTDADKTARASNLKQMSDYISANSAHRAVIVMGDTNTRYTRAGDTIRKFVKRHDFIDGWVATALKGKPPKEGAPALICETASTTCEVVDKIMYRGNNFITLRLEKWRNEKTAFLSANGSPLSDHSPISSIFSYMLNPDVKLSKGFGGSVGRRFTDVEHATASQNVTSITIRSSSRVYSVKLEISHPINTTFSHGGSGGKATRLELKAGEHLTSMEVHWGLKDERMCITFLKFTTSKKRTIQGGAPTRDSTIVHAPKGFQISGFHGRATKSIDALGAIFTKIQSETTEQS